MPSPPCRSQRSAPPGIKWFLTASVWPQKLRHCTPTSGASFSESSSCAISSSWVARVLSALAFAMLLQNTRNTPTTSPFHGCGTATTQCHSNHSESWVAAASCGIAFLALPTTLEETIQSPHALRDRAKPVATCADAKPRPKRQTGIGTQAYCAVSARGDASLSRNASNLSGLKTAPAISNSYCRHPTKSGKRRKPIDSLTVGSTDIVIKCHNRLQYDHY